ncbi:MAG: tail fiber domain-containing protein, partial [Acidobacteria bacterium]|nr:tail fiber domain-containing protein [Acidobacteriota bacterium]
LLQVAGGDIGIRGGVPRMQFFENDGAADTGKWSLVADAGLFRFTTTGANALSRNLGSENSALGEGALYSNTSGNNNTAVGLRAGQTTNFFNANTTGSSNSFIGYKTGPGTSTQLTNATAIGANAVVGASNALVLGSINGVNGATSDVNVGIGTTNPVSRLHVFDPVSPDIRIDSGAGAAGYLRFSKAGTQKFAIQMASDDKTHFLVGASVKVSIDTSGNVGIGTNAPADKLHVAGDIRVGTGTTGCVKDANDTVIAGTCSSDARLKKNIEPFAASLEKVAQLQPVHFDWRAEEFPERHFGTARSFGLIAQEVETVLPELVTHDEQGYKAVKYNELPLLNTQAIGELKVEKDAEIEQLRNEMEQLRAVVEALRQRLGVEVSKAVVSE